MTATLYHPDKTPLAVSTANLLLPDSSGYIQVTEEVATLLGCKKSLVDVLASSSSYVAYSIFDSEAKPNPSAVAALKEMTAGALDLEDEELRGCFLLVQAK